MSRWWRTSGRYTWLSYRWILVLVLLATGLALGTIGYHEYYNQKGQYPGTYLTCVYQAIGLFTFSNVPADPMPLTLSIARFISPLALAATVLSAAAAVFRAQLQRVSARRRGDRLLVIGCGLVGSELIEKTLTKGLRCVAIDLTRGESFAEQSRQLGVPVLPMVANSGESFEPRAFERALHDARAVFASEIIVVTADDNLNARASRVIEAFLPQGFDEAHDDRDVRGRRPNGHKIFVESSTLELTYWLQDRLPRPGVDRIEWFNIKERGARDLLDAMALETPEMAPGLSSGAIPPHLVIVGMTETAAAIVIQFCRNWTYSLMMGVDLKPHVTVVGFGEEVDSAGARLIERAFADWGDTSGIPESSRAVFRVCAGLDEAIEREPTSLVIAVEEDLQALAAGRVLSGLCPGRPLWMCTDDVAGIDSFAGVGGPSSVHLYRLAEPVLSVERIRRGLDEDLARALQAADFQRRHLLERATAGHDAAGELWTKLDDDSKEKNVAAVEGWRTALDRLGLRVVRQDRTVIAHLLTPTEVEVVAEYLHEAWRDVMESRGLQYRTDSDRNTWRSLPEANRAWSIEQAARVPDYLAVLGYVIASDRWDEAIVDRLARAYHAHYASEYGSGLTPSWEDLEEDLREANRESARWVPRYVAELGLRMVSGNAESAVRSLPDDDVERLAEAEHGRWCRAKMGAGWGLGDRIEGERLHPDLVAWADLDEPTKDKDRTRIRQLPVLLAEAGIHLVRP